MNYQRVSIAAFLLLALVTCAPAQTATPAMAITAPAPVASPSMFLSIGGGYNHYTAPATVEGTLNLGVQIGATSFYSISTLSMQSKSATVRSGFGYAIKRSGPVLLILLADGGVTTGANAAPAVSSFALGNVGGGLIVRYDLGTISKKFANVGLSAGVRIASVAGTSVQPEYMAGVSYYLK